jgi:hypothetical protein
MPEALLPALLDAPPPGKGLLEVVLLEVALPEEGLPAVELPGG